MIEGNRVRSLAGAPGVAPVLALLIVLAACAGNTPTATPGEQSPTSAVALPAVSGDPAADQAATPSPAPQPEPANTSAPAADTPEAPTPTPASVIALPGVSGDPYPEPSPTAALPPDPTVVPDTEVSATIDGHTLSLMVVASPEGRAQGLMFFRELPQDRGMLFVFPSDGPLSFWMRNTFIPLSVAFLDSERRILNIEDMQPLDEQTFHNSAGPARYALEVNQGWFAERQIAPGTVVEFTLPADLVVR